MLPLPLTSTVHRRSISLNQNIFTQFFLHQQWHFLILCFVDFVMFLFSYHVAYNIRLGFTPFFVYPDFFLVLLLFTSSTFVFYLFNLYDFSPLAWDLKAPPVFVMAYFFLFVLWGTLIYLYQGGDLSSVGRGIYLLWGPCFLLFTLFVRFFYGRWIKSHSCRQEWYFIGTQDEYAEEYNGIIKTNDSQGISLLKYVDLSTFEESSTVPPHGLILGRTILSTDSLRSALLSWTLSGVPMMTIKEYYERLRQKISLDHENGDWFNLVLSFKSLQGPFFIRIKRLFDLILILLSLPFLLPILGFVAILIWLCDSSGPIIYHQNRVGLKGKVFTLYKFRSMIPQAEKTSGPQWSSTNDPRITQWGKWLRKTRLDELPQILNVVKGEMSLIGPRPERPEFVQSLAEKIPYYHLRHLILPGITGWAQVNYPYGSTVEDAKAKLEYDLYYLKNYQFFLDLAILARTMKVVFFGRGR